MCVFGSKGGPACLSQSHRGSWTIAAWPVTAVTMAVCSPQSLAPQWVVGGVGGVAVRGPSGSLQTPSLNTHIHTHAPFKSSSVVSVILALATRFFASTPVRLVDNLITAVGQPQWRLRQCFSLGLKLPHCACLFSFMLSWTNPDRTHYQRWQMRC